MMAHGAATQFRKFCPASPLIGPNPALGRLPASSIPIPVKTAVMMCKITAFRQVAFWLHSLTLRLDACDGERLLSSGAPSRTLVYFLAAFGNTLSSHLDMTAPISWLFFSNIIMWPLP